MRKTRFCLFYGLVVTPFISFGQSNDPVVKLTPKINETIVYLNGAEIHSAASLALKKGQTTLVLEGFSPDLKDNSLQVQVNEPVEIQSISTYDYATNPAQADPAFKRIQDTLTFLQLQIASIANEIDANRFEKAMLDENKTGRNTNTSLATTELAKAGDFFRERILKINNRLTFLETKNLQLKERLQTWETELTKAQGKVTPSRKAATLVLRSAVDQTIQVQLKYLVNNCGWSATYDLIATDVNKPILLKYKAEVYNHTGIHWDNVKIVLSTADPSLAATRPFLTTWNLNYSSAANEGLTELKTPGQHQSAADSAVMYEAVAISELNTTITLPEQQRIAASDQPHVLHISSATIPTYYEYLTIPKVDMSAFLIAKVTGWENLNLITGPANVYFGNTYLGETKLDTRQLGDTLELSLGRDNQIQVSRTKVKDFAESKFIGTRKEESFRYEIQVKNNRNTPIRIKIQDQVPISQENDISVDIEDVSGAAVDAPSGRLQWSKTIAPGDTAKHSIAFSVKYPKNKRVSIRKERIVRTPRFRH
jgi:uncharacterized protein (TIGR02231 family)